MKAELAALLKTSVRRQRRALPEEGRRVARRMPRWRHGVLPFCRIAHHVGVEHALLGLVLRGESPLILCVAITSLKHELADPGVRVQGQRCMAEVYDLQDLMVRDARVHEPRSNMHGKAESGEPASAFEPTGDVICQRNLLPRDPEYHLARLDDNEISILDADARGDVLEPGVVRNMVDLGLLLEYPEFVPERQIDGAGSNL